MLEPYLQKWDLTPAGEPILTHTSQLLPILFHWQRAMLKVTADADDKHGHLLMRWWAGRGAAQVLAHDDGAVLLERATGPGSLVRLAGDGQDEVATRIIRDVARQLHAPRKAPPLGLVPLTTWFRALAPMAQAHGGILVRAAAAAATLLRSQREIVPLHADLHHENILDFGERGWLAIDPKRVIGERTFEYTILFCDPDLGSPHLTIARRPEFSPSGSRSSARQRTSRLAAFSSGSWLGPGFRRPGRLVTAWIQRSSSRWLRWRWLPSTSEYHTRIYRRITRGRAEPPAPG